MKIFEVLDKDEMKQGAENWWAGDSNYQDSAINHGPIPRRLDKKSASLIRDYVSRDLRPTGDVKTALEKLISISAPISHTILSYRGMSLTSKNVNVVIAKLDNNKTPLFRYSNPMSFTNDKGTAWDFAKPSGYRHKEGKIPVVLEVLIPAGTRIGRLELAFGVGFEHIVSGSTSIQIVGYRKFHTGLILQGKLTS